MAAMGDLSVGWSPMEWETIIHRSYGRQYRRDMGGFLRIR